MAIDETTGVEARVRERQGAHVADDDLDPLADALGLGVRKRRLATGAGLVVADQRSTPTARPPGRRFAAPISSSPRPQPTSRTSSSPESPSPSRSRSRSSSLPRRLEWIIATAVARNMTAASEQLRHRQAGRDRTTSRREERDRDRGAAHPGRVESVVDLHGGPARYTRAGPPPRLTRRSPSARRPAPRRAAGASACGRRRSR